MACPHCDRTFQVLVVLIFLCPKYTCLYLLCFWQPPSNNVWSFSRWRASSDLTWQHTRQEHFIDLSPVFIVIRLSRNNMIWQGIFGQGRGLHYNIFISDTSSPILASSPTLVLSVVRALWMEQGWSNTDGFTYNTEPTGSNEFLRHCSWYSFSLYSRCPVPGCKEAFRHKGHLKSHTASFHPEVFFLLYTILYDTMAAFCKKVVL